MWHRATHVSRKLHPNLLAEVDLRVLLGVQDHVRKSVPPKLLLCGDGFMLISVFLDRSANRQKLIVPKFV
jgi:hypothetical protein